MSAQMPIGAAALENFARTAYQSARTRDGQRAELPLTEAAAWAEAYQYAASQEPQEPLRYEDRRG